MSIAVMNGALCQCNFGVAPCPLVVTKVSSILGCSMPFATIMDNTVSNIATFGMCNSITNPAVASATAAALGVLTPQPCSPVLTTTWLPGSPTVLLSGNPALNHSSKLMCAYAGIIQITNPGQQSIQIP